MAEIPIADVETTTFGNHTGRGLFAETYSSTLAESAVPSSDIDADKNYMGDTGKRCVAFRPVGEVSDR